jgi:gamma-glutamyl:cysteine ligase YbdK (ATP-grasp superfamily)
MHVAGPACSDVASPHAWDEGAHVGPSWARWNAEGRRYTLGVEEELMLLRADRWALAQCSDDVFARLPETLIFQASPRAGPPRSFRGYAAYVEAVDALIASGAVPDPSFLWWDVRLQPVLGTVEVRVMDAQSTVRQVGPLVALVQSLARLELEGGAPPLTPAPEVLAENRFLAARDGMNAQLIDPIARRLVPVRETRRRAGDKDLNAYDPRKGAANVPLARILRISDSHQGCALRGP